ncbi:uncharacterized protein N7498_001978 [Penicillium cinerascens]|uniref:Protein kinase domain-containing protein n=1 Tax=Penicillium cinerascens TaxID=70096 RepID=A0A9W9TAP3_9EURO|nr:uncharacterized protein N7498_001978 [Penicillium cinerascens]KAJ5215571.1 hypothetical protein N7498_001978 [Penicillium cinerascens]
MDSQHRPSTMMLAESPNWDNLGISSGPTLPSRELSDAPISHTKLSPEPLRLMNKGRPAVPQINEDPWRTHEAIMQIFLSREVILARRRENNAELVNVEKLQQTRTTIKPMLDFMSRITHPSFPSLKECFLHENHVFLVWEPLELSVSQLLALKCPVTESELAAIIWPVLEGIQYLRGCGRALAALNADTILLSESGEVKIAGVEYSCELSKAEMNAATLKLFALAEIVEKIIGKTLPSYPWSGEAKSLSRDLKNLSLEELLQNKHWKKLVTPGGLKMLVEVANKTAYHRVEILDRS